jgi:hypothetical protein
MRVRTIAMALLAIFMLTGCYETTDVVIHEPGVYKGGKDPLLAVDGTPEFEKKLNERFMEGQAPR